MSRQLAGARSGVEPCQTGRASPNGARYYSPGWSLGPWPARSPGVSMRPTITLPAAEGKRDGSLSRWDKSLMIRLPSLFPSAASSARGSRSVRCPRAWLVPLEARGHKPAPWATVCRPVGAVSSGLRGSMANRVTANCCLMSSRWGVGSRSTVPAPRESSTFRPQSVMAPLSELDAEFPAARTRNRLCNSVGAPFRLVLFARRKGSSIMEVEKRRSI